MELLNEESPDFWKVLGEESGTNPDNPIVSGIFEELIHSLFSSVGKSNFLILIHKFQEHVSADFIPTAPRLYQVKLGMGYLELPQVEVPYTKLVNTLLNSRNVYILDCYLDLFVW